MVVEYKTGLERDSLQTHNGPVTFLGVHSTKLNELLEKKDPRNKWLTDLEMPGQLQGTGVEKGNKGRFKQYIVTASGN